MDIRGDRTEMNKTKVKKLLKDKYPGVSHKTQTLVVNAEYFAVKVYLPWGYFVVTPKQYVIEDETIHADYNEREDWLFLWDIPTN